MFWKAVGPSRYKLKNLCNFSGTYIYPEVNGTTRLHNLCDKSVEALLKEIISIQMIIVISYLAVLIGPMHAYIFNDIHVTPMGTRLPFFGENSEIEFFVNCGLTYLCAFYALLGNFVIETFSCIINNTILLSAEMIQLNANELSERLEKEQNYKQMSAENRALFRNFLLKIWDFDRYYQHFRFDCRNSVVFGKEFHVLRFYEVSC